MIFTAQVITNSRYASKTPESDVTFPRLMESVSEGRRRQVYPARQKVPIYGQFLPLKNLGYQCLQTLDQSDKEKLQVLAYHHYKDDVIASTNVLQGGNNP